MYSAIQKNWDQYKPWSQFTDDEQLEILSAEPLSVRDVHFDDVTEVIKVSDTSTFDNTSFFEDVGNFFGNAGNLATSFFTSLTDVTAAQQSYEQVAQGPQAPSSVGTEKMLMIGGGILLLVLLLKD